jgi:hypothetical protein
VARQVSFREQGPTGRRRAITAAGIVLLAITVAYLWTGREELLHFQRLSITVLLVAVCLQFLSQLLWNGAMLLPLQSSMERLGFWELFMVRTGGFLAGYVVPVAGNVAVRMVYLKRRGLTYADFTWATLLSNILVLSTGAALAVFAVGILWMIAGPPPAAVLGLTAGVLALGVTGMTVLWFLPQLAGHPHFQRWPSVAGMSGFRTSRRTVSWVSALSLTRHCSNFVTFGMLYQALSQAPGQFLTGGLVYAITSPIRMVPITPGNLGVNEWIVAIVGKALAFDVTTGLIVALVFRGIALVAQGLGVLLAWAWLALGSKP